VADGRAVTGRDMRPPDHMLDLAGVPRGVRGPYKLSGSGGPLLNWKSMKTKDIRIR
jgi:hypothetical protein